MTEDPSSSAYYLARYISDRHDTVSFERALDNIDEPELESLDSWKEYSFVDANHGIGNNSKEGVWISEEFVELKTRVEELTKAYCDKNPNRFSGYLDLIQVTDEKETELQLGNTNWWYTEDQVQEVSYELEYLIGKLQMDIYEEDVPDEFASLFDLNCSIMLYGLDNSTSKISVDYNNGHHTFRTILSRGQLNSGSNDGYARSVGMRVAGVFDSDDDETKTKSELELIMDNAVDELTKYYHGSTRQLVKAVEYALNEYYQ